jgi:methyl-accepting chemotaxis protein
MQLGAILRWTQRLNNFRVGVRLSMGFGLLLVLLCAVAGLGFTRMTAIQHNLELIANEDVSRILLANELRRDLLDESAAMRNAVLLALEKKSPYADMDRSKADEAEFNATLAKFGGLALSETDKLYIDKLGALNKSMEPLRQRLMELTTVSDVEGTHAVLQELRPLQEQMHSELEELANLQEHKIRRAHEEAQQAYSSGRMWMLGLSALALTVGVIAAVFLTLGVTGPLKIAVAAANRMSEGDMTTQITRTSKDELGRLLEAMRRMMTKLSQVVADVRFSADALSSASEQLSATAQSMSQAASEQAASVEETSASVEQMTATIAQNAQNAQHASQLAVSGSEVAHKGGQVVGNVVSTMNGISDSSRRIADIIGVIDSIAFQTNILALNAAVEAARAGEQGRGFAVVAAEVRNLAQRSAAAAKEIKTLIGDSVNRVQAGSKQVDEAGRTMEEIVGSVNRVSGLIAEMAAASQEQSTSVEQINTTMMQLNQITQQNAASSEELAATSEQMSAQAQGLHELIGFFNVDSGESQFAPAAQEEMAADLPAPRQSVEHVLPGRAPQRHAPVLAQPGSADGFTLS